MSKRKKHEEHEEHVNHERWLVSYADMMTLLMVLFIVMFAISQVDQKRFDQLKDGMAAGFGATASPFTGSESTMDGEGPTPIKPLGPQSPVSSANGDAAEAAQGTGTARRSTRAPTGRSTRWRRCASRSPRPSRPGTTSVTWR